MKDDNLILQLKTDGDIVLDVDSGDSLILDLGGDDSESSVEDDIVLRMDDDEDMQLDMDEGQSFDLDLGDAVPTGGNDYNPLINKPKINGVELIGDKTSRQLKIKETTAMTNIEIEEIIQNVFGQGA